MEEYIDQLDLLKIVKNGGMGKGFAFYSLGFVGTLLMTISLITIMANSLNEENIKILKAISELQKYDFKTVQKQMLLIVGNKNQQFDLIDTNQRFNQYEYAITAFETVYQLKQKQLQQSQFIELNFPFLKNKIQQNSCGENCLKIKPQILLQENCQDDCHQYLQSVCLVFQENNIISGCYPDGGMVQYGQKKIKTIQIQLRHNQDPSVLVNHEKIHLPNTYDPLILIIVGGLCLLGCIAIMLMIQISIRKEPIEIEMREMQRTIQNPRLIPLNY